MTMTLLITEQWQHFLSLISVNMADKNQRGLFTEVSQDTTGISNDSEHNSQLLIVRLIEPNTSQRARVTKWCHLQKMNSLWKERKEIWLTL